MFDSLVKKIGLLAEQQPEKLAVAFKKEQLSYSELFERIRRYSFVLKKHGVSAGDRICLSAVSKPSFVVTYLAIEYCHAIPVFLDKSSTEENMLVVYRDSESSLMITDKLSRNDDPTVKILSYKSLAELIDEENDSNKDKNYEIPIEDSLAELLFTTGTTSKPKGVMLSYKAVYNILQNTIDGIGIREDDIILLPLPLNHSFALRVLRAYLYKGATVVLQNGFTFAKEAENNISMYNCTSMACVPTSYEVMRSQMQDDFQRVLGGLRYIEFGAGSLSIRQRRDITALLPNVAIYNVWGSSETGGAIFCDVCKVVKEEENIGALGIPLKGKVEVKFLDTEGNAIDSDEAHPGRMALKGDMQMSGYWNEPEKTTDAIRDGWILTGDMAYQKNGYVFMLGRADDIINVGGDKVSPIEVENLAGQYKGIHECACIGAEDTEGMLGQMPVLFTVVNSSYNEDEFKQYLGSCMEKYKIPRVFVKLQEIPRNRMQKIDRNALRKLWENRSSLALMNPVIDNILSRRSVRKFTDKEIDPEILNLILKCGYNAPSGKNLQTWRFTVLTKEKDIEALKAATKETAEKNKIGFFGFENPKVLILVSNDKRNADGCQDASCAAENMMLAALSFGIGSVWLNPLMTIRDKEPVKSVLDSYGIPEQHTVWASVAMGYPAMDTIPMKKKENVIHFV
ncbi:MAG: AMP-binding protein [Lachnospiraceae bacterium]|nr:AMP-binding protein [Lachnospiraceae bacterium]